VTQNPPQLDNDIYRLVLISPDSRRCLIENVNGTARLPRVAIPKWTRLAEEISHVLLDNWGLKVVVLDLLAGEGGDSGCVLAELCGSKREPHPALNNVWCSTADLAAGELSNAERAAVESLIATGSTGRGAFSRLGWLDDAMTWMASELSDRDFRFSGEFKQFNANASFCLIRLGNSNGPAYWLKAVGEPNLKEYSITMALAKHCPKYVPNIAAARRDWNAWVMEDAGNRLAEPLLLHELESAVISLAELQKCAIANQEILLSSGCFDQRATVLHAHIPELIEYLVGAMAKQTSTKVSRVTESRLRQIGSILSDASVEMEALGIPKTLIHNDFTLGNILFDGSRCVLTDWAEGGIGTPQLTYQHLRAYVSRDTRGLHLLVTLDRIYKRAWSDVLTEYQHDRALILAPLLALASHLVGRGTSLGSGCNQDPHLQRYARGLARHMDRTAAAPELMGAL
jgi:hypothetical protein